MIRHLIALALILILWAPSHARPKHNLPAAPKRVPADPAPPSDPAPITPKHVICAPTKPVTLVDLAETLPPPRLIPRYLIHWEQTPAAEQQATLARQAAEDWPRWLKILTAERARRQTPAEAQRRRVQLFAAAYDLPDPDELLSALAAPAGALAGVGA